MNAPGWPGIPPRWTSSAKTGVGTALSATSRVWFTLSHGIVNEVYWPRVDRACTRDLGLIVTDGAGYFSEEKRRACCRALYPVPGVPAYRLVNTAADGRYRIEKDVLSHPRRDALVQRVRLVPLGGTPFRLYVLLAPHLGNRGAGNTAWVGDTKGVPMLFAERDGLALALACDAGWRARSVGFVGVSDGWQDLSRHGQLTAIFDRAADGNVALTGEVDLPAGDAPVVLALGFGHDAAEAGHHALATLLDGFEAPWDEYVRQWRGWQQTLLPLDGPADGPDNLYRISTAVLRVHEAKTFPGGIIASLSIPWGFAKGDDDLGGYHLVWPRDLVEAAGALLAAGAPRDARRVLGWLHATQEADGHWPQNTWLDGTPYWSGVQMDEVALPVLLVDLAWREHAVDEAVLRALWPMVERAIRYVVQNGPVTQQDRWEEDPGYSPFTLAAEIAALLAAADLADLVGAPGADYLRETADAWNASIERWAYTADTGLAREVGVAGYYVRVAPPDTGDAESPRHGFVPIKNRPPGADVADADYLVSPDALALVRFGLRSPDDPRIVATVKVIDTLLRVSTPGGPAWRRYNGDGYGEHDDGRPFDGTGVGRGWPLLTLERAHFELAAGRPEEARRLCTAAESFANEGGMLPEQVWDAPPIPARELTPGRPSGSAMPLVWAHAEYVKLRRSLRDGRVFDTPPQPGRRWGGRPAASPHHVWRFNHKCSGLEAGRTLRVEVLAPAVVHWSDDRWRAVRDTPTRDTGWGMHIADLDTARLPAGTVVLFTFFWPEAARWEGTDFAVTIVGD